MDFICSTIKQYNNSGNASTQVPNLLRKISFMARQERILKLRHKRQQPGIGVNTTHMLKKISKHARFRRKIIVTHNRYRNDSHQRFSAVQQIVNYYIHIMKADDLKANIASPEINGSITNLYTIFFIHRNIICIRVNDCCRITRT